MVASVLALVTGCAPGVGTGFLWGSAATAYADRMERYRLQDSQRWPGPTCGRWDWQFLATATPAEVDSCLAAGAPGDERDEAGCTPLHDVAESNDSPAVIWILLDAGAWVNARDAGNDRTPLHYAAANNNNPTIITALVDSGADANARIAGLGYTHCTVRTGVATTLLSPLP